MSPTLVLLAAGVLNAMAAPLLAMLHGGDGELGTLLPLITLALLVGLSGRRQHLPEAPLSGVLFALAVLIPSSTICWLAVALFALRLAAMAGGRMRVGLVLLAGVAGVALWQVFDERLLGSALTLPDAIVMTPLLGLLRAGVERSGNIVGVAGGHRIVVLAGCSTVQALPLVVLAAAVLGWLGRRDDWLSGLVLPAMVLFSLLNLGRLLLLGWSAESYHLTHGPLGQNLFDALVLLMLLGLAALRPARRRRAVRIGA